MTSLEVLGDDVKDAAGAVAEWLYKIQKEERKGGFNEKNMENKGMSRGGGASYGCNGVRYY